MSYDIHLADPVTGEVAEVPGHLMYRENYKADYHPETGTFTTALNTEANYLDEIKMIADYVLLYKELYEKNTDF